MTIDRQKAKNLFQRLTKNISMEQIAERMAPKNGPVTPRLRYSDPLTPDNIGSNWEILKSHASVTERDQQLMADPQTLADIALYTHNIENCIGTVKVPVGVAGPLRVNGVFAQKDYYMPMATTEAALVASYNRGARIITESGGCTAFVLNEGMTRSPGFIFKNLIEASQFALWLNENFDHFCTVGNATSRFGKLIDMRVTVEGNHVYVNLDYHTGDAAGQNMATIATAAVIEYIAQNMPVKPKRMIIEANLSGDKKASNISFMGVRGKKVTVETVLKRDLVIKELHTTPEIMVECWHLGLYGCVMGGSIGVHIHIANGLAAFYLATGQDVACVSESSVGITRFEVTEDKDLYVSLTMPNVIVGSVGGGTKLPSQSAALRILGLEGAGHSYALAEVCAALCLAGEISITAAISAGQFANAHEHLARGKKIETTAVKVES